MAYSLKPAARTEPDDLSPFTEEVLQLEADVFEVTDYAGGGYMRAGTMATAPPCACHCDCAQCSCDCSCSGPPPPPCTNGCAGTS